jgi:hypothetical protein
MFLRPNFSIATLTSLTLISATVGAISLLPTVGSAQTFVPPVQVSSCTQLVQRLNLSTEQQEQATIICNRAQGLMTTESITALRLILDPTQFETLEQNVREVQRLINYGNNGCGKSDEISHTKFISELKCGSR